MRVGVGAYKVPFVIATVETGVPPPTHSAGEAGEFMSAWKINMGGDNNFQFTYKCCAGETGIYFQRATRRWQSHEGGESSAQLALLPY